MNVNELIHQKADEQVIFMLRRHILVFLVTVVVYVVLFVLPFVGAAVLSEPVSQLLAHPTFGPLAVLGVSAYLLILLISFMTQFVDYHLDAWIITTERVLSIEQRGLFSRVVSELDLARVQDVTSEVSGFIPSVLGFGNVYIQTAGERERFVLEQVPGPDEVRKRMLDLMERDNRNARVSTPTTPPPPVA
jgi:uncharacterized membrane protein YdbT with pleckstrin-like domain